MKASHARVLSIAWVVLYLASLQALQGLRTDHLVFCAVVLALIFGGDRLSNARRFLLPLILTAVIYDSQRFYADFLRGPIHVREPYLFDLRFFGIQVGERLLTPNEWCQRHLHPVLDLLAGFAYLVYLVEYLLVAAYFMLFSVNRQGARSPRWMMWSFLALNVLGYSTYYWYAAAPPWYVAKYGFQAPSLSTPPSLAGCARFDQMTGLGLFAGWYGRAADVFGAIPSLHVAYPLLATFYAFREGRLRILCLGFYLWMCFSAVYLNHHYILDILWGSSYALLVGYAFQDRSRPVPVAEIPA